MAPKKKSSGSNKENNDTTSSRVTWSSAEDAVLLDTLKLQKLNGSQAENGWKAPAWVAVVKALEDAGLSEPGNKKTTTKCSDHWGNLKGLYVQVHKLRNASGFGWDSENKVVTATEEVWDAYIQTHPKAKRWQKTPFPLYDDIHYLVNGIVATGAGAFHPGAPPAPKPPLPPSPDSSQAPASQDQEQTAASPDRDLLNDEVAQSIDEQDESQPPSQFVDDVTSSPEVTPVSSRKRKRAPTESPLPSQATSASARGRRHVRKADAVSSMADAVLGLADAFRESDHSTPKRRQAAIRLMEDDDEFSEHEMVDVIRLFTKNQAVADSYISIRKKNLRVQFVRSELAELDDEF